MPRIAQQQTPRDLKRIICAALLMAPSNLADSLGDPQRCLSEVSAPKAAHSVAGGTYYTTKILLQGGVWNTTTLMQKSWQKRPEGCDVPVGH
mmetsp:Transcript_27082/g.61732  ORF Transcript_27082/g.61732 Transcript_27082/m.61732 type:complete len:92 (+) Transcript_27082:598-873(+)